MTGAIDSNPCPVIQAKLWHEYRDLQNATERLILAEFHPILALQHFYWGSE
jgi:hypothetical protein